MKTYTPQYFSEIQKESSGDSYKNRKILIVILQNLYSKYLIGTWWTLFVFAFIQLFNNKTDTFEGRLWTQKIFDYWVKV